MSEYLQTNMERTLKNKVYFPNCSASNCDIDQYYLRDKTFGRFAENGLSYVIHDRNTPRPWILYLCNDKIRSAVSNTGMGFIYHKNGVSVTKYYELDNYLVRNLNGRRNLFVELNGQTHEFFTEAENFLCAVYPAYIMFTGSMGDLQIEVKIFVPREDPCECWNVKIINCGNSGIHTTITANQDLRYKNNAQKTEIDNGCRYTIDGITSTFIAGAITDAREEVYDETPAEGVRYAFLHQYLSMQFAIEANRSAEWNIVSAACTGPDEEAAIEAYTDHAVCLRELDALDQMWAEIISRNRCTLPDKNLEYFLNIWLKKQIHLTFRYDRGSHKIGYRDGIQDAWGNILVEPAKSKKMILYCLAHMLSDGRCPRQIDVRNLKHDMRDFADSPIWVPIALNAYIKETGDFSILNEKIGFLDSNAMATVEEHIYLALDYLYHSRGKNGLVLMRQGDWADGLSGINQYGEDATSVWMTIAAYHAQNLMAEIYTEIGEFDRAKEMQARSNAYKEVANTVGWDGNWMIYGFFADGEPIGSARNLEGKIWLNPQTWGIFSGLIDDEDRIRRIKRSVSRYLDTPYGAMVNYPPYVFYGERNGRIQKQHPGVFLNASIYNHAASFKVFSDVKMGDYDEAYDTISRCLPNHPDNSDTRRTSEPFTVGNVYYGIDSDRAGMNLFSWFTATPSWLIHGGFEEILGVKAGFHGLEITPHVPEDWNEYTVTKRYRGTEYRIHVLRVETDQGIYVNGQKQDGYVVRSDEATCEVEVHL